MGATREYGHKRLMPKSDKEPAILELKDDVLECLPIVECIPKGVPAGDKRSNEQHRMS